jgi:hypothetical protein
VCCTNERSTAGRALDVRSTAERSTDGWFLGERSTAGRYEDGRSLGERSIELGLERHLLAVLGARLNSARTACREAGDLAAELDRRLVVGYTSSCWKDGQAAKQTLAVLAQLSSTLEKALADAQGCFAEIDRSALTGLRSGDDR